MKVNVFFFHRDMQTFEESFSYACPKFISPVPPNFDAPPANFSRVSILIVYVKHKVEFVLNKVWISLKGTTSLGFCSFFFFVITVLIV